jgi:type IV pilus biogenesis protein CpaD/CtpE
MATKKQFAVDISAAPQSTLPVRLVGVEYTARPPKAALALSLLGDVKGANNDPEKLLNILSSWLEMTFGTEVKDEINARLADPGDQLDIPHVAELMHALMEQVTGNPTM